MPSLAALLVAARPWKLRERRLRRALGARREAGRAGCWCSHGDDPERSMPAGAGTRGLPQARRLCWLLCAITFKLW